MSGNTLGKLFTVTTFGESHGPAIGCVIDGCPPGMGLTEADIQLDLDRRKPGTSRHVTQRQEAGRGRDPLRRVRGPDHRHPDRAADPQHRPAQQGLRQHRRDLFRPGHADYTYWQKYGIRDYRGGGRSSARLTAPIVGAGAVAKKWLRERFGIEVRGYMSALGEIEVPFVDWSHVRENPFFAPNAEMVPQLEAYMDALRKDGDSIGARIDVVAEGVPAGWGEPVFDRLDADIAHALMSINAVKGVEIGAGFASVAQRGTEHRDELTPQGFRRQSRGRHPRRHLDRPGPDRVDRHQADLQHPHAAPLDHQGRRAGRGRDLRPPRPLRGHPRHADRRGDAGAGADRPRAAPSRAMRRRRHRDAEDRAGSAVTAQYTGARAGQGAWHRRQ